MAEKQFDVVIIGAGISGLAAAHFLKQAGKSVAVIEKEDRAGGVIESEHSEGFLIERGPNSTMGGKEPVQRLIEQAGLLEKQQYAADEAKFRYIVKKGRLVAMPTSPQSFLKTPLFSLSTKLGLLKEPFIKPSSPNKKETLAEFVERRLGREFLDYAIDPFVAGVYAGKPQTLIVKNAFKRLYDLEQEHGSLIRGAIKLAKKRKSQVSAGPSGRIFSFDGGMQTMTDTLAQNLGRDLFTSAGIKAIKKENTVFSIAFTQNRKEQGVQAKALLSTVPSYNLPQLALGVNGPMMQPIEDIPYAKVVMVYFGYNKKPDNVRANGFGFLVPSLEKRQILGTLWNSTLFAGRAPQGGLALSTFVGGSRQPELTEKDDDALKAFVQNELADLMGIAAAPDFVRIVRWQKAIPQYTEKQDQALPAMAAIEENNPGLFIGGNFRDGISVSDCIVNAEKHAERVVAWLK